ncbi:MAG: GxxExxY protein [Gemmatimonadaceae bacterium]|nr:GxxExxY protein [Gemmatimonadaceae bacterium]
MTEDEISRIIVDAAIEVQRILGGPGLLESIYEEALTAELKLRGLRVHRQAPVVVTYKGQRLACTLRVDLLVNQLVIVECKSSISYNKIFESQALTYVRLCKSRSACSPTPARLAQTCHPALVKMAACRSGDTPSRRTDSIPPRL